MVQLGVTLIDATVDDADSTEAAFEAATSLAMREAFEKGPFPRWSATERADAIGRLSKAIQARGPAIADAIWWRSGGWSR